MQVKEITLLYEDKQRLDEAIPFIILGLASFFAMQVAFEITATMVNFIIDGMRRRNFRPHANAIPIGMKIRDGTKGNWFEYKGHDQWDRVADKVDWKDKKLYSTTKARPSKGKRGKPKPKRILLNPEKIGLSAVSKKPTVKTAEFGNQIKAACTTHPKKARLFDIKGISKVNFYYAYHYSASVANKAGKNRLAQLESDWNRYAKDRYNKNSELATRNWARRAGNVLRALSAWSFVGYMYSVRSLARNFQYQLDNEEITKQEYHRRIVGLRAGTLTVFVAGIAASGGFAIATVLFALLNLVAKPFKSIMKKLDIGQKYMGLGDKMDRAGNRGMRWLWVGLSAGMTGMIMTDSGKKIMAKALTDFTFLGINENGEWAVWADKKLELFWFHVLKENWQEFWSDNLGVPGGSDAADKAHAQDQKQDNADSQGVVTGHIEVIK